MSDAADTAFDPLALPRLRSLIGLRVRHQGTPCVVIEVLDSPPSLVLELLHQAPTGNTASLLPNLHGQVGDYGVESRIVRVLTDDLSGLNDALLELEILDP